MDRDELWLRAEGSWTLRRPPVARPVSLPQALQEQPDLDLLGARVVVGDPRIGIWIYDQRCATKMYWRDHVPMVGILAEHDWYRLRRDPTSVVVPHETIAHEVFYEIHEDVAPDAAPVPPDQSDLPDWSKAAFVVTNLPQPPVRWPRNASTVTPMVGARCWLITPDGLRPGCRVVAEPRRAEAHRVDLTGGLDRLDRPVITTALRAIDEEAWYRWRDTGQTPRPRLQYQIETSLVYLE